MNSDEIAAGIIDFYKKKLHSPLVIGQNNDAWSKALNFPSIDFHLECLGSTAVKICLRKEKKQIQIASSYVTHF